MLDTFIYKLSSFSRSNPETFLFRYISLLVIFIALLLPKPSLQAQQFDDLSLSVGFSAGVIPEFTLGDIEDSGNMLSIFGELQYKQVIGQLSYTSIISETIGEDQNELDSGYNITGSLGYSISAGERLEVPLMLSIGGTIINYSTIARFGTPGNSFTDGSWQAGITVAPRYSLTDRIAAYGELRFMQAVGAGEGGEDVNLTTAGLGIRITLL